MLVAGCGGQQKQDVNEPRGSFPIAVEKATFPASQKLAESSSLQIVVRNAGTKSVPNISVTVKCPGQGPGGLAR